MNPLIYAYAVMMTGLWIGTLFAVKQEREERRVWKKECMAAWDRAACKVVGLPSTSGNLTPPEYNRLRPDGTFR